MNKIIIGIPTYNRHRKCLNLINIICNIKEIFKIAEIYVIDNSLEIDNKIEKEIKNTKLKYNNFNYIRNEQNLGLDRSILKLIDIAIKKKSKLWFLCDDDEIFPDEIINFLKFMLKNDFNVVLNNFISGIPSEKKIRNNLDKNYEIKKYLRASFLPTVAINTDSIESTKNYKKLIGTNYIHIGIINSLVNTPRDIIMYEKDMGIQKANMNLTFELEDTFIKGYLKCLQFNKIIPNKLIMKETSLRCKGYLGVIIKNFNSYYDRISFSDLYSISKCIRKNLGAINFIILFPRIIILCIYKIIKFKL